MQTEIVIIIICIGLKPTTCMPTDESCRHCGQSSRPLLLDSVASRAHLARSVARLTILLGGCSASGNHPRPAPRPCRPSSPPLPLRISTTAASPRYARLSSSTSSATGAGEVIALDACNTPRDFNDLPDQFKNPMNMSDVPNHRRAGDVPPLDGADSDDVIAVQNTLTDGFEQ